MAAYVVLDVEVTDPQAYEAYKKRSGEVLAQYGGRFLARGGPHEVLEGTWEPHRIVILEFDSVDQAKAWWSAPEYAEPKAIRQSASRGNMVLVTGVDNA